MKRDYQLEKRKYIIGGAVVFIVVVFMVRLLTLQIMSDDYKKNADSNALLQRIKYPARGLIYDREGRLLVFNQPAYDITVVMKEVEKFDTLELATSLGVSSDFLKKRFRDMRDRRLNPGYSRYTHQVLLTQLSSEDCAVFREKLFKFRVFISRDVLCVSMAMMLGHTFLVILQKFQRVIWLRMSIMREETS